MKILKYIVLGIVTIVAGACEEGIDPISKVAPGPDESAPLVAINFPSTDKIIIPVSETETSVNFKFEVNDDIEIGSVTASLDGSEIVSYSSFIDYRRLVAEHLQEGLAVGNHTIVVKATDLSGKSTTETFPFEVSNEYVPKDGEIFYMSFDGDQYLDLITETQGTPGGSPAFAEGIQGSALSLNAESKSYLLFPGDALAAAENFTLSFWVNPDFVDADANGSIDGILGLVNLSNVSGFWGNVDLFVENNSNPDGAIIKGHVLNANGGETWVDNITGVTGFFGEWTHHVLTFDGTSLEFNYYINGELIATKAAGWTGPLTFADSGPMVFGAVHFQTDPSLTTGSGSQPWASYLTGELDEIRIFNKALSSEEVLTLFDEVN